MKPTIKVFISQPMAERSEETILGERSAIKNLVDDIYGKAFNVEFIDSYNQEEGLSRIEMLGNSIKMMADADLVVFAPRFWEASGCQSEYDVARNYCIPIREIAVKYKNDHFDYKNNIFDTYINVSEWRWADELNN